MYDLGLEKDLFEIFDAEQASDIILMTELYSALCNVCWVRTEEAAHSGKIDFWSCTWRTSGAIVAEIRNEKLNLKENYLDFYCAGGEGEVSARIRELLGAKGWTPLSWDRISERNGN